jgi:hypothetical protein
MSFYYWRTVFAPDSGESAMLRSNDVHNLYVRYFEVDWADTDSVARPFSPVRFDSFPSGYSIVPVIHFQNRVFEKLDARTMPAFTGRLLQLVGRINASANLTTDEIQSDCDWTENTQKNYFNFLREMRNTSGLVISSTIRLQQLNFFGSIGIPPVDHGVLLLCNTDTAAANPAYERATAHRYIPSLRTYPLTLDLALPIFPSVTPDDLKEMVGEINQHSNHRIRDFIFFDLSPQNISRYDKGTFHEILDHSE